MCAGLYIFSTRACSLRFTAWPICVFYLSRIVLRDQRSRESLVCLSTRRRRPHGTLIVLDVAGWKGLACDSLWCVIHRYHRPPATDKKTKRTTKAKNTAAAKQMTQPSRRWGQHPNWVPMQLLERESGPLLPGLSSTLRIFDDRHDGIHIDIMPPLSVIIRAEKETQGAKQQQGKICIYRAKKVRKKG